MSKVMIHPASYDDVREAVRSAFKLFPLQVTSKKVLIKPNVLRSSEAEEGIVTHPAVLKAVVEKVEEMEPASLIVGTTRACSITGQMRRVLKRPG